MMSNATIKIGTRASALAMWQAQHVKNALITHHPKLAGVHIDIIPMTTNGDKQQEGEMSQWGYKGLFTKEIEEALLTEKIDIAVHSLKDMPTMLPDGLVLGAYLPRENPQDALILHNADTLDALPAGAIFGTASLRRAAQIKQLRPDLTITPLRGNIQTRLRKVHAGEVAGTMLALAGLNRMGLADKATEILSIEQCLPAVAQGIIAVECRAADVSMLGILAAISDETSFLCATAERAMLKILDGSCRTPIAGYATIDNNILTLRGKVLREDGTDYCYASLSEPCNNAEDAEVIGVSIGTTLRKDAVNFLSG